MNNLILTELSDKQMDEIKSMLEEQELIKYDKIIEVENFDFARSVCFTGFFDDDDICDFNDWYLDNGEKDYARYMKGMGTLHCNLRILLISDDESDIEVQAIDPEVKELNDRFEEYIQEIEDEAEYHNSYKYGFLDDMNAELEQMKKNG